jgi:hypothetical protein
MQALGAVTFLLKTPNPHDTNPATVETADSGGCVMLSRLLIVIGVVFVVVGMILRPTRPERVVPTAQTDTPPPTATVSAAADNANNGQPTATAQPTTLPVIYEQPPLENVLWHDPFENQASGWEQRYEVPYQYTDGRLVSWNGYQNGTYAFMLNGRPSVSGEIAPALWDFNGAYRLPAYPYRVRADVSVHPAGNAMLLLDYAGSYTDINSGDGIAVVWGQNDGFSYNVVDTWDLTVYEFHSGRTWTLGCSAEGATVPPGIISRAVVDVDQTQLNVTLYTADTRAYQTTCARIYSGAESTPRSLGIGSVYPRPAIPTNDYNLLAFQDIYLMQLDQFVPAQPSTRTSQEVLFGCTANWQGGYTAEDMAVPAIPIAVVLSDRTDCSNPYRSYASDFPGYGPERVAMQQPEQLIGSWYCGSEAPSSRFSIRPENDYLRMLIDNELFYVFAAANIESNVLFSDTNAIPFGYVVTGTPTGGNRLTFQPVDFVSIGDGIGVFDQQRYFFTFDGTRIYTNWNARDCQRE